MSEGETKQLGSVIVFKSKRPITKKYLGVITDHLEKTFDEGQKILVIGPDEDVISLPFIDIDFEPIVEDFKSNLKILGISELLVDFIHIALRKFMDQFNSQLAGKVKDNGLPEMDS